MAWEHKLAKEFNKRNNSTMPPFFTGEVKSPHPDKNGNPLPEPLLISLFGGEVVLDASSVVVPKHVGVLLAGYQVALVGSQKFLVVGVV
jgi:hypothetical protein